MNIIKPGGIRAIASKIPNLFWSPVIAVYPLGFAEGPITATKVASSRAVKVLLGKASHC